MSGVWGWTWDVCGGRRSELYLVDDKLFICATLRPMGYGSRTREIWEYETRATRGQSDFLGALTGALEATAPADRREGLRDAAIPYVKWGMK